MGLGFRVDDGAYEVLWALWGLGVTLSKTTVNSTNTPTLLGRRSLYRHDLTHLRLQPAPAVDTKNPA